MALHTGVGFVLFQLSTFAAAILIARALGPAAQGRFQLWVALSVLLVGLANLGLDEGIAYELPRLSVTQPHRVGGLVRYSLLITSAVSVVIGISVSAGATTLSRLLFGSEGLARELRMALFLVPGIMALNVASGILRGLGRSDLRAFVYYYLVGPGFLAAVALLALSGLTLTQVEVARTCSYLFAAALAILLIARTLRERISSEKGFVPSRDVIVALTVWEGR